MSLRADLLSQFRSTRLTPRIEFGSRRSDSGVRLQTSAGRLARGDWIRLPLTAGAPGMAAVMPGAASTAAAVTAPVGLAHSPRPGRLVRGLTDLKSWADETLAAFERVGLVPVRDSVHGGSPVEAVGAGCV